MANHKSAIKRIRQTETRKLFNKYFHKTARNAVRKLKELKSKKAAIELVHGEPVVIELNY